MSAKQNNQNPANSPPGDSPPPIRGMNIGGMTIGDFEILNEIGRGGMGVVYRARQISLDRIVALKILAYGRGMSDQAITRFRREAQATAKLHHPNIVPVFAQGQQDNTYFYAMELVSGTSLYDAICQLRMGGGPESGKSRDKSPSSSEMKLEDGKSGELAETEFLEKVAGESTSLTPERPVIQPVSPDSRTKPDSRSKPDTPAQATGFDSYTSEYFDTIAQQIRNVADALEYAHNNGVIHRDIKPHNLLFGSGDRLCLSDFGLARVAEQPGVTQTGDFVGSPLYMPPEQITGKGGEVGARSDIYSLGATLYEWLTLTPPFPGATREQVISRVITEDPPSPRSINRRIPLDLETICLKALSRDPSRRYASAAEFKNDLTRFLNRSAIKAKRAGFFETIGKTISRYRVASVVIVAIVLLAALTSALIRQKSDSKSAEQEVAHKQKLVESVTEKNKELEALLRKEENNNPVAEPMQRGEQLASMLKGPLASLLSSGEEESDSPLGDSQRIGAMFVAKMRATESQRLADLAPGTVAPESTEGLYISALTEDNPKNAVTILNRCLESDPGYVPARLLRAWHKCRLNDLAAMRADAKAVLELQPQSAEGQLVRAAARILKNRFKPALDDVDQAAQTLSSDVRVDLLRGLALSGLGRGQAALNLMNLVLIIEPDNSLALMTRAKSLFELKRFDHAIVDLTKVIEQEANHMEALELRGDCYDQLGQFDLASADFFEAGSHSQTRSLAGKIFFTIAKRDKQQLEDENKAAELENNEGDSDSEVQHAPVPDPSKAGAVKDWLENLIDNSKEKRQELRVFQSLLPVAS